METKVWIAIGIVFVVVWGLIIWELWTTPVQDPEDEYQQWIERNTSVIDKEEKK